MAKPKSSAKGSGAKNPDRRNGKAWKKPKAKKVRTPERQEKDFLIRLERERRQQERAIRREREHQTEATNLKLYPESMGVRATRKTRDEIPDVDVCHSFGDEAALRKDFETDVIKSFDEDDTSSRIHFCGEYCSVHGWTGESF
jgi:hypothetical protein